MSRPVVITCAVTGAADTVGKHPAIPVAPQEIAQAAIESARAGAAIVHLHVRDPESGKPSMEFALYEETVRLIRESGCDVVVNLTTGAGGRFTPSEADPRVADEFSTISAWQRRVEHVVRLKPEICSLDVGSFNLGEQVFVNTPAHLRAMADAIRAAGTKPEMEVFELGHIRLAKQLIAEGLIDRPPMFQLCLGIAYAAPANSETMLFMRNQLPEGAVWAAFGIGAAQMPMVAQAALLGGHVRVGLEDNLYLRRGEFAPSNAVLVERAKKILSVLGFSAATPDQARELLGRKRPQSTIAAA